MKFLILFVLFTLLKHAEAGCYAGTDPPSCDACGGTCLADTGCVCDDTHDFKQCMPTLCAMESSECCLTGYYWSSINSCCTDVFICSPPCADDELCVNKNNNAICECNLPLYNGKTLQDFKPTVECEGGTMTTSISKCLLTRLGYDYSSLHVRNTSVECNFNYPRIIDGQRVETNQVQAKGGWCGNTVEIIDSRVYFTNTLHIGTHHSAVITKNPIAYNYTCGYNLTMQTSLQYALNPVVSTATLAPVNGAGGSFSVSMAGYKDTTFTILWADGEYVTVGTDIFLGIFVPDADGTNFTVRVESCIATPTNNSNDVPNIQLVSGGCARTAEVDCAIIKNGQDLEAIIRFKAFQFEGYANLFISCQVALCEKGHQCEQCVSQTVRTLDSNSAQMGLAFPVEDNSYISNLGSHTAFSWAMMAGSFLAFLCMNIF